MAEGEDEDTEQLFIKILVEMGIEAHDMKFHAVHRVGPPRNHRRKHLGNKPTSPRHIIARFLSRKDRIFVWENRGKLKDSEIIRKLLSFLILLKNTLKRGMFSGRLES